MGPCQFTSGGGGGWGRCRALMPLIECCMSRLGARHHRPSGHRAPHPKGSWCGARQGMSARPLPQQSCPRSGLSFLQPPSLGEGGGGGGGTTPPLPPLLWAAVLRPCPSHRRGPGGGGEGSGVPQHTKRPPQCADHFESYLMRRRTSGPGRSAAHVPCDPIHSPRHKDPFLHCPPPPLLRRSSVPPPPPTRPFAAQCLDLMTGPHAPLFRRCSLPVGPPTSTSCHPRVCGGVGGGTH